MTYVHDPLCNTKHEASSGPCPPRRPTRKELKARISDLEKRLNGHVAIHINDGNVGTGKQALLVRPGLTYLLFVQGPGCGVPVEIRLEVTR
jgi:hypothetical protein